MMETTSNYSNNLNEAVLATILADESYTPSLPSNISETGLPSSLIESLILKRLAMVGIITGRQISKELRLPLNVISPILSLLREQQKIVHQGSAPLNDYNYSLTETGKNKAQDALSFCAYNGPAPVPLTDYVWSVEAQTIRAESPKRNQLLKAFSDISIDRAMFEDLGPAINSGAGLFLYGEPGNGKSTIAQRITKCFGQKIWIPHAIYEDGQIIKVFDQAVHKVGDSNIEPEGHADGVDPRWVKIERPTVIVGGELTMESLDIRHDSASNVSEASLQMKSNCGCLVIDDFGRQRIQPHELLNRWIVPLESNIDYLELSTGKKIQVPFEQLIIFSTNLDPSQLVDDAFLRRIPYKIELKDPSLLEFELLFKIYCKRLGFAFDEQVVKSLIDTHFTKKNRRLKRCHPRDLLRQIANYCSYAEAKLEIRPEYFERAMRSYFAGFKSA